MKDLYSKKQKNLIMLQSDLLGNPLTLEEKTRLQEALVFADGDIEAATLHLPPAAAAKVESLLSKGLKLSLELEKLGQRGITVLFAEKGETKRFEKYFPYTPSLLFILGNGLLIDKEDATVSLTLSAFRAAGHKGIFIIDRAFEPLLRDKQILAALREKRAVLVSDLAKTRATVNPSQADAEESEEQRMAEARQPEKRVFISGSRSQSSIPKEVQESLDAIIDQGIGILIGDSNKGVDNEIIDFLRVPLYEHVTIYTISARPRINPEPEWSVQTIEADKSLKPQQRQMAKDRTMADDADWGLALFNPIEKNRYGALQVSSGTLRNTIQMLLCGKMVKFFYAFEGGMKSKNLKTLENLESVIKSYRLERLSGSEERAILSAKGVSPDDDAASVKSRKIMDKYGSLLKDERKLLKESGKSTEPAEPIQAALPLFD